MKKLIIAITCLVSSFAYAQVAEWSEPIEIAVDSGHVRPNLCIDKLGNFHLVFQHEIQEYLHQDIYYKKSIDLGETWSSAKDISLNEHNLWYADPQICTDSENNIHIAFGEHKGDKAQRVLYTSCNAQGEWQQNIDTIAEKNPSEYQYPGWPLITADTQDNLILTWGLQYPKGKIYYRIKDKVTNQWGDIHYPFNERATLTDVVTKGDTMYYVGSWMENGANNRTAFYTSYSHNVWQDPIMLSNKQISSSRNITLDKVGRPSVVHIEKIDTSDVACCYDYNITGNIHQEAYTILPDYVGRVYADITYDQYNQAHVVQNESIDGKEKLMHYQKTSSGWVGEQLDINYNHAPFAWINLHTYGEDIYLVYVDWEKVYGTWEGAILLRKYTPKPEGIADNAEVSALGTFKVYPNPVQGACHLDYQLANTAQVDITVYDMQGRQVSTIYQGQQAAGAQQLSWDGSSLSPGVYIVRLQAGKYVVNRKITVK